MLEVKFGGNPQYLKKNSPIKNQFSVKQIFTETVAFEAFMLALIRSSTIAIFFFSFFVQALQEFANHVKKLKEKKEDMDILRDLKSSVKSLEKKLAWAFVAEKKQVQNI